jgi:hypothetical protein
LRRDLSPRQQKIEGGGEQRRERGPFLD